MTESTLLPARVSIAEFGTRRQGTPLYVTAAEAFLSRYSGRTLTSYANDLHLFFQWCERADIVNLTPHTLRRTFITISLDAGVSLRDVQHSAGHADPRTTSRYDRLRNNLARNACHTLDAHVAGVA